MFRDVNYNSHEKGPIAKLDKADYVRMRQFDLGPVSGFDGTVPLAGEGGLYSPLCLEALQGSESLTLH